MKNTFKTLAGLAAFAPCAAAQAADLPVRTAPPAPPPLAFSWTGFYVGGQLGWVQASTHYGESIALLGSNSRSLDKNGALAGLFLGYNYQAGQMVFGVEADGAFLIVGKDRYTAITGDVITAHTNFVGSARGRIGYAIDRFLVYATGGVAFGAGKTHIPETSISIGSGNVRWGWTLGAGVEYALTNNWIVGVEYRYSQYETKNYTFVGTVVPVVVNLSQEKSTNQVAARVSYKF